jgi:peptidoglycan/LPS O-acetylase OafA/YrhL
VATPPPVRTHALPALDWIRALAAIAVLIDHVYAFLFAFVPPQTVGARILTFPFSLGHEAVLVFFVLSGFLVAGSVSRAIAGGRWSWPRYILRRGTRLYVVLAPALLLGALWDHAGLHWLTVAGRYANEMTVDSLRAHLAWPVAVANLAFLQKIIAPTFGTNGPLWSLSNEFWYYLIFPCALLAIARVTPLARAVYAVATLAIAALLYKEKLEYIAIWLLGWAVFLAPSPRSRTWTATPALAATIALFLAAMWVAVRQNPDNIHLADGISALCFCPFLYVVVHRPPTPYPVGTRLAGFAYTLYATHFPPLLFVGAWVVRQHGSRWPVDPPHIAAGTAVAALLFAYAAVVAQFTEARTDAVRAWISRAWSRSPSTGSPRMPTPLPDSTSGRIG